MKKGLRLSQLRGEGTVGESKLIAFHSLLLPVPDPSPSGFHLFEVFFAKYYAAH